MNISTFFIDKLSGTSPESSVGKKKSLMGSYMFSDIIQVCENESTKSIGLQNVSGINPADETLSSTENVIQVSTDDLSNLLQFINAFFTSNPEIQSTESTNIIDATEINKKQFVVDEEQLAQFVSGLINKISSNSEITSCNEQKDLSSQGLSIVFTTDSGDVTLNIAPLKNIDPENTTVKDKMLESIQSLISADGKDTNIVSINGISKLFPSNKTNSNNVTKDTKETENAGVLSKQESSYKPEVIQIPVQGENDLTATDSEEKKPVLVEYNFAKNVQSPEQPLKNLINISSNNNAGEKKPVVEFSFVKNIQNVGQLLENSTNVFHDDNTVEKNVNLYNVSIKTSSNENIIKPQNIFSQNNYGINNLIKELNVKQISVNMNNQPTHEMKMEPVGIISGKINLEKKLDESILINNTETKKAEVNILEKPAENILEKQTVNISERNAVNIPAKPTVKEVNDKNAGPIFTDSAATTKVENTNVTLVSEEAYNLNVKPAVKENKATENKDVKDIEAIKQDNDKQEKQTIQNADPTRQENKDQSRNTAQETIKNSIQQIQTSKIDFDSEKIKLSADAKIMQEAVKNIKANDLVPEISKLIAQGEKQSMTFQLSPENLGKVKLSVEIVNNQISTKIEVENENIKQFIQSNVEQLKHNLQLEGIKNSSVNISLADYDQRSAKPFTQKKKYNNYNEKDRTIEDIANVPLKKMGYNTYEYLA